jgi:ubiquinone/menaquinone biosynthesis C-methylase UbiE
MIWVGSYAIGVSGEIMSDLRQKVNQQFGTHAQNYVTSTVHASGYSLERLLGLLNVQPGQQAIDIATGGGHVALGLAKRGAITTVTDLTPRMLGAARPFIEENAGAEHQTRYVQVDGCAIPFADHSFDIVTCRIAPHHFPHVQKFVQECARVCKPGGTVGVVDQVAPFERDPARYLNAFERLRDPSHVWEYSQADWEWFYDVAGLKISHAEICRNRLEFGWWVKMQNVPAANVTRLEAMLRQAPRAVAEWLQPELQDVGALYFSLWQLILIGKKTPSELD